MARYTNAKSVDVLDSAESFERKMRWQDFQIENEQVVYGDYTGWQPGDPLLTRDWLSYSTYPIEDSWVATNTPRPMIDLFDDGDNYASDEAWRCRDCHTWWIGESACFSCHELRLHVNYTDEDETPVRSVSHFDAAYPGEYEEPELRDVWSQRTIAAVFGRDAYELDVVSWLREEMVRMMSEQMDLEMATMLRGIRGIGPAFREVGRGAAQAADAFDQFNRVMGEQAVPWRALTEVEPDMPRRLLWQPRRVGRSSQTRLINSIYQRLAQEQLQAVEHQPRFRWAPIIDEWAHAFEREPAPEGHVWTHVTDDNGEHVSIHIPRDIPTRPTYEVPRVSALDDFDPQHRTAYDAQRIWLNQPITEQRRRRDT